MTSTDPNRPGLGVTKTMNFNIMGPGEGLSDLSDTLSITVTGIEPGPGNVSVEVHFRSDSLFGVSPMALANAMLLTETGMPQSVAVLTDLAVVFNSDVEAVPEPSTFALFGLSTLGLLGYGWRR